MSQFDFGNLSSPLDGADFFDNKLEPWRDALHSMHSGNSRPSYAVPRLMWCDTTTTPWVIKIFTGSVDIVIGTVSTATGKFVPGGGALNNLVATANPTVSNDGTQGYASGSLWMNTVAASLWYAQSVGTGAAVWVKLSDSSQNVPIAGGGTGAATAGQALGNLQVMLGQCRLDYVSGTQLKLSRSGGVYLTINGIAQVIPSAGVTLANTGLSATTLYYIYAYINAGVMTLEAVATTHATDSTTGVEIKSGDSTRTLVGMIYTGSGTPGIFNGPNLVLSWFNRRAAPVAGANTSGANTTSVSVIVEINTAARAPFLTWANQSLNIRQVGIAQNSAVAVCYSSVLLDGTVVGIQVNSTSSSANYQQNITTGATLILAEGYHYATVGGAVSSGTGTFFAQIQTEVQG